MNRFSSILFCPLARRDNPAAVRRVRELVVSNGATLTLMAVGAEPSRWQRILRPGFTDEVGVAERGRLEAGLRRCLGDSGIDASLVVESGDPALRIIERVLTEGHDLVVVTADDDRADHATIRRLLRKCPCPVWVIRPTRARTLRVLAAVDPDPEEDDLNRTILDMASSMVDQHGGELHVVHAWELYGEDTLRSSAFVHLPPGELDALLVDEHDEHARALDSLLSTAQDPPSAWTVHLEKGGADVVVPALVAKHRINLLVMGTVARGGFSAMVMGNTAERVLDEVRCSVIAVKPDGFVSPIAPPSS